MIEYKDSETIWRTYRVPRTQIKFNSPPLERRPEVRCRDTKIIITTTEEQRIDLSFLKKNEEVQEIEYYEDEDEILITTTEEK
jgi:hypothetical protein